VAFVVVCVFIATLFHISGALEGAYYIKSKMLIEFPEQQIASCDTMPWPWHRQGSLVFTDLACREWSCRLC
jgi:hypothetical protein